VSGARPAIVVQARTGSTRLPRKVLLEVQGDTLLGHQLRRLQRCRAVATIVVATTERPADAEIVAEAERHGAATFRGSEEDVLARYLGAAAQVDADPVIRITSDCPLIDPEYVDAAVTTFLARAGSSSPVDVVTNGRPGKRTFPRGLDVEVVARRALALAADRLAADAPEREHVTQYLYRNPGGFRFEDLLLPLDLSFLRFTVDTAEDFELVRAIYDDLYPENPAFALRDVLALLGRKPELLTLNAHVRQKGT
jgi:spore coat polysaccharide biosynthesis protein SpsF